MVVWQVEIGRPLDTSWQKPHDMTSAFHLLAGMPEDFFLEGPRESVRPPIGRAGDLERDRTALVEWLQDVVTTKSANEAVEAIRRLLEAEITHRPGREVARRRQDEILATEDLLDDAAVRLALNADPRELRRAGLLLAVWDGKRYLYPAVQIDRETRQLRPRATELFDLLPKDPSGWQQALWLYQPHATLCGKTPAEVFPKDPGEAIKAARRSFQPGDTNW